MKKILVSLFAVTLAATVAQAAGGTEFSDNFDGTDGTIVAPGAMWGYTNIGVERSDWATYPRPDAQDLYCISNNQLFMYVGPTTNAVGVYNKVQAALTPLTSGTQLAVDFTSGQIECSFDLMHVDANLGNRWNLNQEIKVALNGTTAVTDPGNTDAYYIKCTVNPSNMATVVITPAISPSWTNKTMNVTAPVTVAYSDLPINLKMVAGADSSVKFYTNNVLVGVTNGFISGVSTMYPFIWDGMFSGEGTTPPTEGDVFIDNYNVKWTPEPGVFALLLLALPLLRKFC